MYNSGPTRFSIRYGPLLVCIWTFFDIILDFIQSSVYHKHSLDAVKVCKISSGYCFVLLIYFLVPIVTFCRRIFVYFFVYQTHPCFYSSYQLRYGHLDANKKLRICNFTFTPSSTVTLHLYEHMLEGGVQTFLVTMFLLNNEECHPITRTYILLYIEVPTTLALLTLFTGSLMIGVIKLMIFFIWYCNDTKPVL